MLLQPETFATFVYQPNSDAEKPVGVIMALDFASLEGIYG